MKRTELFRLDGAVRRDPKVEAWFQRHAGELGELAREWFESMRDCGDDVLEVMHDDMPTACVGDAAFAYVNVFAAHISVDFFHGSELPDPSGILQGSGKFMRHVKISPSKPVNDAALHRLIDSAYMSLRARIGNSS